MPISLLDLIPIPWRIHFSFPFGLTSTFPTSFQNQSSPKTVGSATANLCSLSLPSTCHVVSDTMATQLLVNSASFAGEVSHTPQALSRTLNHRIHYFQLAESAAGVLQDVSVRTVVCKAWYEGEENLSLLEDFFSPDHSSTAGKAMGTKLRHKNMIEAGQKARTSFQFSCFWCQRQREIPI